MKQSLYAHNLVDRVAKYGTKNTAIPILNPPDFKNHVRLSIHHSWKENGETPRRNFAQSRWILSNGPV